MKIAPLIIIVVLLLGFVGWRLPHSVAQDPVENQIRGFGPQVAQKLAAVTSFDRIPTGYTPRPALPPAPAGLKPLEQQAWFAFAQRKASEVAVDRRPTVPSSAAFTPLFPEKYSTGTQIHALGMAVTLRPLNSTSSEAQIENGKLVYHLAYASTDSLQVVTAGRSEEFLLLHDANAPQRFEYELTGVSGVKNITLKADGAIHFQNAKGQDLQIEAPWLAESSPRSQTLFGNALAQATSQKNPVILSLSKDHLPEDGAVRGELGQDERAAVTADVRRGLILRQAQDDGRESTLARSATATSIHWQLTPASKNHPWPTLALVLDNPKSLHYPLVIDPSWSALGTLSYAPLYQTATLLTNGKVLVAGGEDSGGDTFATANLYDPATGTWSVTGSLNTARALHTATLLPTGQVLVAGGTTDAVHPIASAEIFDPATGTWTATGSLNTARCYHSATLLANGKVLVAGGANLPSAEIYDPSTGTWSPAGSLNNSRSQFTATLLPDGKVLAVGGIFDSSLVTSSELYDPSSNSWSITGFLNTPRFGQTATLLPNGQVLVAGGYGISGALASSELYDPSTALWTVTTGSLNTARGSQTANLLPNGQVLVTGGLDINGFATTSTETYNSTANTWTASTNMTEARVNQTATLLASGDVLVAGGTSDNTSELYDYTASAGTFSNTTGSLPEARDFHTTTLLANGQVLVAGGENDGNLLNDTVLYNPSTGTWSQTTGSLATQRDDAAAVLLPNGKVLIAGGVNFDGNTTGAEIYDPSTGTWTATGSLTDDLGYETATLLPNGQVLIAGGIDDNGTLATAELYNPATGTWTNTGSMANARANHTATLLPNGEVLVAGGGDGSNGINSAELYNPGTGTWTATGSLNTAREYHSADLLPNGQVLVEGGSPATSSLTSAELYNPATGTWSTTGSMNTARKFQGSVLRQDGKVLVTGGLQGSTFLTSAELYDPATGSWTATGSLANARDFMTDTLLSNGQILIVGGTHDTNTATELYNPGFGFTSTTQPEVDALTNTTLFAGNALSLTGGGFTGTAADLTNAGDYGPSEASGGNGGQNSPSNLPVVKLESLVNEETVTLPVDETIGFSDSTFTSQTVTGFPPGYALLTMFVNGTPSASQIFLFSLKSQTIPPVTIGNLYYTPNAITLPTFNSSAGLPVTVTVQSGPATISGSQATLTGVGQVTLAANQAGNSVYSAAPQITASFTVLAAPQTITFPSLSNVTYGAGPITLGATASSGLAVTYTTSGPVTLSGSTLTITGAGKVSIRAHQAGNTDYQAAPPVLRTFTVSAASQTITWTPIPDKLYGNSPFRVTATASSGLGVTYSVLSGPATINDNLVTLTGGGKVELAANQAGNAGYSAAPEKTTSFTVNPGKQTITFPTIGNQSYPSAPITLTATSSSGLTVTYDTTGPIKVSGNTLTITGPGTAAIGAHQAGNVNYAPAPEVRQTFTITATGP